MCDATPPTLVADLDTQAVLSGSFHSRSYQYIPSIGLWPISKPDRSIAQYRTYVNTLSIHPYLRQFLFNRHWKRDQPVSNIHVSGIRETSASDDRRYRLKRAGERLYVSNLTPE